MNTISFRLKSEMKFQSVEIDSTFISAGELRQKICEKLRLDPTKEAVQLWDVSGTSAMSDDKQIARGTKLRVARGPVNRLEAINATDLASKPESVAAPAPSQPVPVEEPDEFGGDVFGEEEQMRRMIQDTSSAWQNQVTAGQRQTSFKFRTANKAGAQPQPWYSCNKCGEVGQHFTTECPHPEVPADKRPKRENQMRGVPVSLYTRSAVEPGEGQPQPATVKLNAGDLQREEQEAETAKQRYEQLAAAPPTLAPLPSMLFEDQEDPMAVLRAKIEAQQAKKAAMNPVVLAPAPSESLALPASTAESTETPALPAATVSPADTTAVVAIPALMASSKSRSRSPEEMRSAFETDPSLLTACELFLPDVPRVELLYEVFGRRRPLTRTEWEDFVYEERRNERKRQDRMDRERFQYRARTYERDDREPRRHYAPARRHKEDRYKSRSPVRQRHISEDRQRRSVDRGHSHGHDWQSSRSSESLETAGGTYTSDEDRRRGRSDRRVDDGWDYKQVKRSRSPARRDDRPGHKSRVGDEQWQGRGNRDVRGVRSRDDGNLERGERDALGGTKSRVGDERWEGSGSRYAETRPGELARMMEESRLERQRKKSSKGSHRDVDDSQHRAQQSSDDDEDAAQLDRRSDSLDRQDRARAPSKKSKRHKEHKEHKKSLKKRRRSSDEDDTPRRQQNDSDVEVAVGKQHQDSAPTKHSKYRKPKKSRALFYQAIDDIVT